MKQRFLTICLFCWVMVLAISPFCSFGRIGYYFLPHLLEAVLWILTGSNITIYLGESSGMLEESV